MQKKKKEGCYVFICMSNNTILKREKRKIKIGKSET